MGILRGFKDFIMRGNVIDLAVAVVIGAAFGDVVKSFTTSFLQPLINLVGGGNKFAGQWHVKDQVFSWSAFLNAVIAFVLIAATVYFIVVLPMNKLHERMARGEEPKPKTPSEEVQLLTEIRDALVNGRRPGAAAERADAADQSAVQRVRRAASDDRPG